MTYSQRQKLMKNHYDKTFPYRVVLLSKSVNFDGVISEYVVRRCKDEENAKRTARSIEKFHKEHDANFVGVEIRKVF